MAFDFFGTVHPHDNGHGRCCPLLTSLFPSLEGNRQITRVIGAGLFLFSDFSDGLFWLILRSERGNDLMGFCSEDEPERLEEEWPARFLECSIDFLLIFGLPTVFLIELVCWHYE